MGKPIAPSKRERGSSCNAAHSRSPYPHDVDRKRPRCVRP
ncbi:hypothetical protein LG3211_0895 [Lysobacter gummosus]|nr:hypothetical protein LG3211_0895 [Lysobacter gummosus]